MKQIYALLYNNNVEVVLNGHDHIYERFSPQDPNGLAGLLHGIREFIVGSGGANHTSIAAIQPNSEVRNVDTFGALKFTLHPDRYDWQFMPVLGRPSPIQAPRSAIKILLPEFTTPSGIPGRPAHLS